MRKRKWLRRGVAAVLVLLAASLGFSRLLRTSRMHRYLSARLEAAFGRPVEVGDFGFNLLDGLRLEADSVSVAEDPRFGQEYFLRAERLTAGLRWRSLARGRFDFGTLSFTRPSLNLVRAPDGRWNVESWLPPPATAGPASASPGTRVAARLYRIEVDAGRINFKHGVNKDAFALVDVTGHLEQEGLGRWIMDLEARPMRATVALQEVGTLRLRGRIAGTSARLQPADLMLTWQNASLADALRLARGRDYGARGRLAVELVARIAAPGARWFLAGTARLSGVHRWDLPPRSGDPALNVSVEAQWRPGEARVELNQCAADTPRSMLRGRGSLEWAPTFAPRLQVTSSVVHLGDALAWYRAFRPGVAEGVTLEGYAETDLVLSGWPLRLEQGGVASEGARLRVTDLREPIRLGRLAARVSHGRLELDSVTITLPAGARGNAGAPATATRQKKALPGNALRVGGSVGPPRGSSPGQSGAWSFDLGLVGQTDRVEDLLVAAAALGHPLYPGWNSEGPVSLDLRWQGSVRPFSAVAQGVIALRGLRLRAGFLNQPVTLDSARIELNARERRVTLSAAQALGAHWTGWLRKRTASSGDEPWEFDLAAERLDTTELDRWLGPRARPGLLERLIPFAGGGRDSSGLDAVLARLAAAGMLRVDEVVVPPLGLHRLLARLEVLGRNITLGPAQADFYGGTVRGALRAELAAQPSYRVEAQLERVSLAGLADATATLQDRFGGAASGMLHLTARGIGRENLLASLEGSGALRARGLQMRGWDLRASFAGERVVQGTTQFAEADGTFSVASRKIHVDELRLSNREDDFVAAGTVDFSRALDLTVRLFRRPGSSGSGESLSKTVRLAGSLDAPQIIRAAPPPGKR